MRFRFMKDYFWTVYIHSRSIISMVKDKIKYTYELKLVSDIKCSAHVSNVANSNKLLRISNYSVISQYFLSFHCFS